MRSILLSALVLATGAVATHAQTNVSFEMKVDDTAYTETAPAVQADFNNDGKPDIIYSDYFSDTKLTLRLGNGDGTFQAPVLVATADSQIVGIKTADFDHDGNADIMTINSGGTFDVFFGSGSGTFPALSANPTTGGSTLAVADFNSDHLLDVALSQAGNVLIYNNVGGRSFVLNKTVPLASDQSVVSMGAGDFDGDGIQNLVVMTDPISTQSTYGEYILWNDGDENFTKVTENVIHYPQQQPGAVTVADLNQDGMDDIIFSYDCDGNNATPGRSDPTPCQGVAALYGQGQHRLFQRQLVNATGYTAGLAFAADVNGDGIADLVTSGLVDIAKGGLFVYLGHPDGSYDQTAQQFIVSSAGVGIPATGDFNRDGMIDFVTFATGLELYLNATNRAPCATSQINPTVTACAPVEGTYIPGPSILVQANAYDTHPVTALQLYANGNLDYSQPVSSFQQSFSLSNGSNLLVIKAWDETGLNFRSQRHINVYSGTPGSVCPAALSTASICLPAGATSSSPVHIIGNGYTPNIPTSAELFIDGHNVLEDDGCYSSTNCEGGSSALDTYQTLAAGTHDLVFKLWDDKGNVYTTEKSVTVQ